MASEPTTAVIRIPILLWRSLVLRLREQSAGVRESGAFLLGRRNDHTGRVSEFVPYDALDPHAYNGAIAFHAAGYAALWRYCRDHKLEVLADVHTHPGPSVGQSSIDRENPMLPVVGHTAIILPKFAGTQWWSLKSAGIYEYLGSFDWRACGGSGRVTLTLW